MRQISKEKTARPECFAKAKCIEGEGAQSGFTIIEIMIVIAIIGLTLAVVVPRLTRNNDKQFSELINSLKSLTQFGYTNALVTGKIHRLFFDIKNNNVRLEQSTGKVNAQGKFDFKQVNIPTVKTKIALDERFEIRHFMIQNKDEAAHGIGVTKEEMWFFIMPDGLVQEVTLAIYDVLQERQKTLIMNPFTAQFREK